MKKVQVWVYLRQRGGGISVLILKTTPERGGFWQPITGHVEKGETPEKAALREAEEETGMYVGVLPDDLGFSFEFQARGETVQESVYGIRTTLRNDALPSIKMDPKEHVEYRWVSPQEAFELLKYPSNAQGLNALLLKAGAPK